MYKVWHPHGTADWLLSSTFDREENKGYKKPKLLIQSHLIIVTENCCAKNIFGSRHSLQSTLDFYGSLLIAWNMPESML